MDANDEEKGKRYRALFLFTYFFCGQVDQYSHMRDLHTTVSHIREDGEGKGGCI